VVLLYVMKDKRVLVIVMGLFVFGVFVYSLVNVGLSFTGFAVFDDSGESDFDLGVYDNTFFNGSGVVLSGDNLSGSYVSRVFDAGADASWNNMSWVGVEPSVEFLYCVDGRGDVFESVDDGVSWVMIVEDYGRTSDGAYMFSDGNYLYVVTSSNREVWRSSDGESWSVVNDSFADSSLLVGAVVSGGLFVADASGDVYMSSDSGVSWVLMGDFNGGASNNAKGMDVNSSGGIFVVDGSGAVFSSVDFGVSWLEVSGDYGGGIGTDDLVVFDDDLYILLNKDIYWSVDGGVIWDVVNDSFTGYSNDGVRMVASSDALYIADASGRFWKSIDSGVSWVEVGDCNNAATNDPKGLTNFVRDTDLSFQVRSCDDICSGESWIDFGGGDLGLSDNRYFQYRVNFSSPGSFVSSVLESVEIDYDLVNQVPSLSIVVPQDGASYGYNESLALEYSVSDADGNLDSCWYNIDGGANVSLVGCGDNSFRIAGNGSYVLNLFANDSFGLESSDSVSFDVLNSVPVVEIVLPVSVLYTDNESLSLEYTALDIDGNLDSCWYDVDGVNVSLAGCGNVTFDVGGSGNYVLVVYANDSLGMEVGDSVSFSVDVEGVGVNLSEPTGEKDSRTGIEVVYNVEGVGLNCWYNVETSIGGSVIGNTSLVDCNGSSFDVSADGDYVLNLFVNNSYGSFDWGSLNFSVDSSEVVVIPPSGGSSGGGGGGGGSFILPGSSAELEIDVVDVIVSRGEEKSLLVGVKNVGRVSANKCGLIGGDFVESNDILNIGVGEIVEFGFVLRALDGVEDLELVVRCLDDVGGIVPLSVEVLKLNLDVLILGIGFEGDELIVDYSVEPTGDSVSVLYFRILDSDGMVVGESIEEVNLVLGEVYEGSVVIGVGDDVNEGMLRVAISDGDVNFVEEDFVYGGGIGVTGFASFDWGGDFSYIGIILVVFLVLAGLLVRRIWKLKKK